jgi:CheY-like chemotaxis protein/curved DNA-binding protein CbpA
LKTILLAEHHPPTRDHLQAALVQAGYAVKVAPDAGKAMELFVSDHPAGVVMAVDLPRIDGSHLGQLLRAHDQGVRIPLLAIDKGHLGKARGVSAILDLKANAYLVDPMKTQDLLAKLETLLAGTGSTRVGSSGVQSVLSRPPVASGELRGFPLASLLHAQYRLGRDGVLVVAYRDLTRRVYLLKGAPVSYDSTSRQDSLPHALLDKKDLSEDQAALVLRSLSTGTRIGTALAEAGVSVDGEEVLQKVRDYTREKTAQVIGMREGRYALYAGSEFAENLATVDIPALAPILEGARRTFPLKVFANAVRNRMDEFPHRTAAFGRDLAALGLDTQDLKVAMQMNGRIALRELLAHGRGELRHAYSLVWFLALTGTLEFLKKASATVGEEKAFPGQDHIAPRRRKPLPKETVAQLRDAAVKIITGSYFRVLGLDISADTEAVEKAYHEVATRFHPDSYPDNDTSEIQDLLDSVQDKLSASYRVLSIEEKRRSYLQYLISRLDVGRSGDVQVDAEIALKRGNQALKRKDLPTALRAFEEAVELNPREPEYYAHLAWVTYLAGSKDPKERAKAAQKLLKKALGLNPYLERALIISSIIETDQGEHSSARKKLLKVLELNPHSQLAKAALRKVGR